MSNPFFTSNDDVDDDDFLNHSRTGNSGYMLSGNSAYQASSTSATRASAQPQDQLLQIQQRRREIEQRTLDSSQRSIGLLHESERTGAATAEELGRQKEQLKRTEARLNDINSTLKSSERHLQGIKSVFGGIRNYFRGGSAVPVASASAGVSSRPNTSASDPLETYQQPDRLNEMRQQNHPGLRVQHRLEDGTGGGVPSTDQVNAMLDRNLEEMSMGLSRLKDLSQNLNRELDEHNDIIERIDNEAAIAGLKVDKQNKQMNKLLKK